MAETWKKKDQKKIKTEGKSDNNETHLKLI